MRGERSARGERVMQSVWFLHSTCFKIALENCCENSVGPRKSAGFLHSWDRSLPICCVCGHHSVQEKGVVLELRNRYYWLTTCYEAF